MHNKIFFILLCSLSFIFGIEPNPPLWPVTVLINPNQEQIDIIYSEQGGHDPPNNGEWSTLRYAMLFSPGLYQHLTINVGYYTTIAGTGKQPSDVKLGNIICENGNFDYTVGALNNFWRGIENFETTPTTSYEGGLPNSMLWAVSQASPMRRIIINGNLQLWQYNEGNIGAGYASGGYMSNSIIYGTISSGTQQQWFTRNTYMNKWDGGVWNMVYAACIGAPQQHCSNIDGIPVTITGPTQIAEKPYIYFDPLIENRYYLQIPVFEINKMGPTESYGTNDISIDFENVYVTNPVNDNAGTINEKIISGIDYIVISPGNYDIATPIMVTRSNMVILGLGMATLTASNGNIIIEIIDGINGVRIAGLLLDAGAIQSSSLLSVGSMNGYLKNKSKYSEINPTILYDIFVRVGGKNDPLIQEVMTQNMVEIYNDYTIYDNPWLWRADHDITGIPVQNGQNPVQTGLIVYGNSVVIYGLASEHTLGNLVEWNGNNGEVYFYQSEFAYDVTELYALYGYCSFKINETVTHFKGYGMGSYSYFRDHIVIVPNGISTPNVDDIGDITLINSLSVFLNGYGGIRHVVNDEGNAVNSEFRQSYVCNLKA